jgi:N-acetylglutamate synthase-like GNAT family acetyltransferase
MISSDKNRSTDLPVPTLTRSESLNVIPDKVFTIRPATQADFLAIRNLIDLVEINPLGLDWRRFIIAADVHDCLVGCGQVKPHRDGSLELASIAVRPEWRERGVARAIIMQLLKAHPGPLYLICRNHLRTFYEKLGFVNITDPDTMPLHFRWLIITVHVFQRLALIDKRILKISNLLMLGVTQEPSLIMRCDNKS